MDWGDVREGTVLVHPLATIDRSVTWLAIHCSPHNQWENDGVGNACTMFLNAYQKVITYWYIYIYIYIYIKYFLYIIPRYILRHVWISENKGDYFSMVIIYKWRYSSTICIMQQICFEHSIIILNVWTSANKCIPPPKKKKNLSSHIPRHSRVRNISHIILPTVSKTQVLFSAALYVMYAVCIWAYLY